MAYLWLCKLFLWIRTFDVAVPCIALEASRHAALFLYAHAAATAEHFEVMRAVNTVWETVRS